MAPLGASSITTAFERFRHNDFNAFALVFQSYPEWDRLKTLILQHKICQHNGC
jgi:hypothetical protein